MSTDATNSDPKFAWRNIARKGLPKRSAPERLADFMEIHGVFDEKTAREQAMRCIQCPNPSCVSGCPLCNPIPQWMQLTAEGRFLEAAAVLGSVSNLAEICARLCPSERLCEHTCILDGISEPVAIASIEQFLADYGLKPGLADVSTPPPNGLKVAVLGSGPGGLACAEELVRRGYAITILDSAVVPGGLLVNGTPAFKLERSIVQRRIELLRKRGVVFKLGLTMPDETHLTRLRQDHDAVFIGLDSRQARRLDVPGSQLAGVIQSLPFILQKNTPVPLELPAISMENQRVVVLGAGDTAMDTVRTALRCGAREVICCYRRDETSMPCTPHDYEDAREEGGKFIFQAAPVGVLGSPDGRARALRLVRTVARDLDAEGRTSFSLQPGTEFELDLDWLILALGFDPQPLPASAGFEELATNERGGLIVDANQMTSVTGVFAGGDLVHGPSLILQIVRDARNAAEGICRYLAPKAAAGGKLAR